MYTAKVNHNKIDLCTKKGEKHGPSSSVSKKTGNSHMHRYPFYRQKSYDIEPTHKNLKPRRMTISGYGDRCSWSNRRNTRQRRRINSIALPTKFLLGGNITDPLNLKSLEIAEFTPPASPVPLSRRRTQVKVLIPPNIYDPLNLNTGEEILFKVIASKSRKRKRHRKNSAKGGTKPADSVNLVQSNSKEPGTPSVLPVTNNAKVVTLANTKEKKAHCVTQRVESKPNNDKIVSPVVPQGSRKFFRRFNFKQPASRKSEASELKNEKKGQKQFRKKEPKNDNVFKKCCNQLRYGSYPQYNRSPEHQDARFKYFDKNIFSEKNVLDLGCNVGHASIYIAERLQANHVTGVDIDPFVINIARKHLLKHWQSTCFKSENFPISMSLSYGPISRLPIIDTNSSTFPHNVTFVQGNYVLNSDEELQIQQHEYDVILCLRVSKWIHLNWGDDGLKRSFKRMFTQLRYGGQLIFEPQPWTSYAKVKKLTPAIYDNYNSIQLKPENFIEYLMSEDVGFTTCTVMARAMRTSKGIKQPMYLLTKGFAATDEVPQPATVSPVVYNDAEWADKVDEEQDSCCEWEYAVISGDNSSNDCVLPPGNSETSHYDAYASNHTFLDDYNFFSAYDATGDTFE